MDPFYVFIVLISICVLLLAFVIVNQIIFCIRYKKQCKIFDQIAIGERYKEEVYSVGDPFDPPVVSYYRVTNKKIRNGIRYIQLESELSGYRKSEDIYSFFERYTKCDNI